MFKLSPEVGDGMKPQSMAKSPQPAGKQNKMVSAVEQGTGHGECSRL